jgi:peptidoglycan hydrolase-like protein with peptidoglycan-binding domain
MDEPTLQNGSQGEWVTYLQQLLSQAGYDPGGVDGVFGDGTLQAVRNFQNDQGLAADGIVGAATWAALTGNAGAADTGGTGGDAVQESDTVPPELVQAGAPASLSEWSDEQKEAFFNGPVTQEADAGTPEEVPLLAMADTGSDQNGEIA